MDGSWMALIVLHGSYIYHDKYLRITHTLYRSIMLELRYVSLLMKAADNAPHAASART